MEDPRFGPMLLLGALMYNIQPQTVFKLFIDWLLDLSTLDPVFEGENFQVLTALATSFHALQPLKVPAFRLFS
ncbi:unnamed protein product [Lactuca virosa]|uniref:Rab-GAP TBC domain-containing protein n=1 Tax=Lactuca virosa TaxID=75947 RepID=A0AAU9N1L3_9ASTR|nr:unnamed protein product [Lactuca virosa]